MGGASARCRRVARESRGRGYNGYAVVFDYKSTQHLIGRSAGPRSHIAYFTLSASSSYSSGSASSFSPTSVSEVLNATRLRFRLGLSASESAFASMLACDACNASVRKRTGKGATTGAKPRSGFIE